MSHGEQPVASGPMDGPRGGSGRPGAPCSPLAVILADRPRVLSVSTMARLPAESSSGAAIRKTTVTVMTDLLPRRGRVALVCAGVLGLAIPSCTSAVLAPATSARGSVTAPATGSSAGQQRWVTRHSEAAGTAVAASPTGGAVFVTGSVTIGYDAATGAQQWVSRYDGPAKMGSMADAVTASPDGSRVFVTGQTWNAQRHPEYATVAYDASAGTQLWASLHAGHAAGGAAAAADARAIVASPDGKVVYVTGFSGHAGAGGRIGLGVYDYVTIAYDAATGKALWSARYDNGGNDQARAIVISPSGSVVYVTGGSFAKKTGYDDATIAYNAATGKQLWVARYNGKASKNEFANAITLSPNGKAVYITGGSRGRHPARTSQPSATTPRRAAKCGPAVTTGPAT